MATEKHKSNTPQKAKTYTTKLKRRLLPNRDKWVAIIFVMEPAILHPLVAGECAYQELCYVDKTIDEVKCHALGLNEHFPWTVLLGPAKLGGMAIPMAHSQTTSGRRNYFYAIFDPIPPLEKD
jgi:hypothetical protein